MLSQPKDVLALTALLAPLARAQYITRMNPKSFPDDKINATVTVHFDGYNITAPFSNSSKATVPWQARLDIRANVPVDELENGERRQSADDDDDDDDVDMMVVTQIKLAYGDKDSVDSEDVDDSWGYCAAVQPLYNVSVPADEPIDSTCQRLLEPQCLDWLHEYVNSTEFCESSNEGSIHLDINSSPWCQGQYFPQPEPESAVYIPEWSSRSTLTKNGTRWYYAGDHYDDKDDREEYDNLATRVFVLLASWGESNESDSGTINNGTLLNGTVLCLRANETRQGSRSMEEIAEDGAATVGGTGTLSVLITLFSVAMMSVAF